MTLSVYGATGSCLNGEEGIVKSLKCRLFHVTTIYNLKNDNIQLVCPLKHKKANIPNLKGPNEGVVARLCSEGLL